MHQRRPASAAWEIVAANRPAVGCIHYLGFIGRLLNVFHHSRT
jgi:hypothetical protein